MYRLLLASFLVVIACESTATPSPAPLLTSTASPSGIVSPSAKDDVCHRGSTVYCIINPSVTQNTIGQTICKSGWTATIRPPVDYTNNLKFRQLAQFNSLHTGDSRWTASETEEDHRLPLELGGAPSDQQNLSPEIPRSPNPKDSDENTFKSLVCQGKSGLVEAQVQFIAKWLNPYPGYKQ